MRELNRLTILAFVGFQSALARESPPAAFLDPPSAAVDYVDPLIGTGGYSKGGGSGGMIPSVAPPFGMTRWVAQTRENYVSVSPYNVTQDEIYGFQGTHQPAIWMGESGTVVLGLGVGSVKAKFEDRGMGFNHDDEVATPSYYSVNLNTTDGKQIFVEQSATSRVGHTRLTFPPSTQPFVTLEASRASVLGSSDPTNVTYPLGSIAISPSTREVCGSNAERQDFIIGPNSASKFKGYFCARFDVPFEEFGTASNGDGTLQPNVTQAEGTQLSGYVRFEEGMEKVNVRVGVSFISVNQARMNLEAEVPDGQSLEETARGTRQAWVEKLERVQVEGGDDDANTVLYTALFHSLQYPYEQNEDGKYFSGYDDQVHEGDSYSGYSIWDVYRAEWAWLILLAPERIDGMVQSMLNDYTEGGWLPMWKNIVETNIMVGTHSDSLIAEAVLKGFRGFNATLAWEAVHKDATVPPVDDWTIIYSDRQQGVGYEVRAGLSSVYETKGWVANDVHSESASRTLDYSYDDFAVSVLGTQLNIPNASFFQTRAFTSPFSIFNVDTGFMEAKNASGAWAGPNQGWTEGDMWAYTFDVVHDIPGLIEKKGGNASFVEFLDEHFNGGHNDHTNEPSHHIPYLYSMAGAASSTQSRVREIAQANYNASVNGLSGNEDCGQMSAWYIFSALGFYPVNPVSGTYVVGSPFFDKVTVSLPSASSPLTIVAPGASTGKPYVCSLTVNGESRLAAVLEHEDIKDGGDLVFEMSTEPCAWASDTLQV